jgi:hypothetical protein
LILSVLACSHARRAPAPHPDATASVGQGVSNAPAHAAPPVAAQSAAPVEPPPAKLHCKALGKSGTLTLSSIKEDEVQLATQGDSLFALGYTLALARTRLYRVSRAGGPIEPIAEQKGVGDRTHFALVDGAAYYTQAGKLFKLGPDKGVALKLYEGVHSPVAVTRGQVFVIACDSKSSDHLLQIPSDGGAAETVAELPRASHDPCRYASIMADERAVFIADWNGSRVLAVARADKSVTPIVSKQGFPSTLSLDKAGLAFTSALGVFHVDRQGGSRTQLVNEDVALAPYALTASYGDELWVFDNTAYGRSCNLYRLSQSDHAPKPFLQLHDTDPNGSTLEGFGLLDFTVDDECVYVAQTQYAKPGTQILVKLK